MSRPKIELLRGVTRASQNLGSFCGPLDPLLDQKCNVSASPSPNAKTTLGSVLASWFLIHFLLFSPCSLFFITLKLLLSSPFCNSLTLGNGG